MSWFDRNDLEDYINMYTIWVFPFLYFYRITLTELWAAPQSGLTIIGKFNIIVRLDSNQIS